MGDDSISTGRNLPPLRIHHFLVWTAIAALSLAYFRWSQTNDDDQPAWLIAVGVVSHVTNSAAFACVGFGLYWRLGKLKFPSEPGHWIAIQTAIGTMIVAVVVGLFAGYRPHGGDDWGSMFRPQWVQFLMRWTSAVVFTLFGVLNAVVAARFVIGWRWRIAFCVAAWLCFGNAAWQSFIFLIMENVSSGSIDSVIKWANVSVDALPTIMRLLLLGNAVIYDFRQHCVRHWSHWVGVGVWSIDDSITSTRYVAAYLLGEL